jgi:hypothetical protein
MGDRTGLEGFARRETDGREAGFAREKRAATDNRRLAGRMFEDGRRLAGKTSEQTEAELAS